MQPARFKPRAEGRTCSPVRRPSPRGHARTMKTLIMAEGQGEGIESPPRSSYRFGSVLRCLDAVY